MTAPSASRAAWSKPPGTASGRGRRKRADGRWEVFVGGEWLPEGETATIEAIAKAEAAARREAGEQRVTRTSRPLPTERQEEVWEAVKEHGTQTAAAEALGTSQGSIQSALKGYMKAKGIEGPLPGLRPRGYRKAKPEEPAPATPKRANDITTPHASGPSLDSPSEPGEAGEPAPDVEQAEPVVGPGADHASDMHRPDPVADDARDVSRESRAEPVAAADDYPLGYAVGYASCVLEGIADRAIFTSHLQTMARKALQVLEDAR